MPINKKAMANFKKEYGEERGERYYYASVNKGKISESARLKMCREAFQRSRKRR